LDIDLEDLAAVVRLLKEAEFSEFRYASGDVNILVRRGGFGEENEGLSGFDNSPTNEKKFGDESDRRSPVESSNSKSENEDGPSGNLSGSSDQATTSHPSETIVSDDAETFVVKSPLLSTFYQSPKPGEPPFVRVGDEVEEDTVLCILEVMKLMNSVVADCDGVVVAIHAKDGDLIEHGQDLFTIRKKSPQ